MVTDLHGHVTGDRLLQQVANVLAEEVRDTDTAARIGGDEFLILLPDATADTARSTLERVHDELKKIAVPSGTKVSFSIGACTFHDPVDSIEGMLRRADEQMYVVKRSGKDAISIDVVR